MILRSENPLLTFLLNCRERSGDFENPGQLPVQDVLRGTEDCVSWNFIISQIFMFLRKRNPC